jgi:G3E family GTPase
LISEGDLGELKAIISSLNPIAKVIISCFSKVESSQILNTGLFDYEKAESSAGWIQELKNRKNGILHQPETEEYGIASFVFRDKRLFHPERF